MYLIKSKGMNPQQEAELRDLTKQAIDYGLFVKTLVEDEKKLLQGKGSGLIKSTNQGLLGMRLLGQNYMEAFNFYYQMGEYYFGLITKEKGLLPTAKACYVIAAENLHAVR